MNKELLDFVSERVDILEVSDSSKQTTKDAARAWKEAVAAEPDAADEATEKLLDYVETMLLPIDGLIAFLEGPGIGVFGEQKAAEMLAWEKGRKARGEKYCDCETHTAETQLLAKFGRIEL